jgi:hypothetical protein
LIVVSIGLGVIGVWYLIDRGDLVAGLSLLVASAISTFLSRKVSALEERLDQESKEHKKLAQMVARLANQPKQPKIKKNPSKREPKSTADLTKAPETSKPSKPKVPKPLAPEPPEYLEPESPEFLYPEAPDDADYGPEEPVLKEPDPAVVTPVQSTPVPKHSPVIITRTSTNAGRQTQETWKGERTWSSFEVEELVGFYLDGELLDSIAIKLRIDKKDVIYKLTRLNFDETGDLDVTSEAPNDGRAWSDEHSKKLLEMNEAGITLSGMASILGRTKLAIGWRLAEKRKLLKLLNSNSTDQEN